MLQVQSEEVLLERVSDGSLEIAQAGLRQSGLSQGPALYTILAEAMKWKDYSS